MPIIYAFDLLMDGNILFQIKYIWICHYIIFNRIMPIIIIYAFDLLMDGKSNSLKVAYQMLSHSYQEICTIYQKNMKH